MGNFGTLLVSSAALALSVSAAVCESNIPVNISNFARAETDRYMALSAAQGGFGRILHIRAPVSVHEQDIIRMNRDTLYSGGVFDVTSPVTVKMPESEGRFQSLMAVNQDHYIVGIEHDAGEFTFTSENSGTQYIAVLLRTFMNPNDPDDIAAANALQDDVEVEQESVGTFDVPNWERESLDRTRGLLNALAADAPGGSEGAFGTEEEVHPTAHVLATAAGWGGNPDSAAMYEFGVVSENDGKTLYAMTVKDVPVDGFWSLTVYNEDGFMQANDQDAYSVNNVTAERDGDGAVTIHFGGCEDGRVNCLPITDGWNFVVRLYRPRAELLEGNWSFPGAVQVD